MCTFWDVTKILSSARVRKNEWTKSGIPFYRSSDVMAALNGEENKKAYISEKLYKKLSASSGKLEKVDILVTGGGSIGNLYIVPDDRTLYTKDADLPWIKNSDRIDPYFVYSFFYTCISRVLAKYFSCGNYCALYNRAIKKDANIASGDLRAN